MYDECEKTAKGCEIRRVDVKSELENSIKCLEKDIKRATEQLRKEKEKLRLISKNKDLEAYLNLTRNNY